MSGKRKICVVTGTRADYGLLYWVMKDIQADAELELSVIATCMHLSPEFGLTYRVIEEDGFQIDAKVEMLLSADTSVAISKSMGLANIGFADALDRLQPDIMIVLGDRFELLAAAQVALVARIPIAHIAGGDTTEGAYDEAIRHSITKMANLHFVTNVAAERRVRQLGENPDFIFNYGSPGLDYLRRTTLLDRKELEESINYAFRRHNLLITFHPVTLDYVTSREQFTELLKALESFSDDVGFIFTMPNADNDSRILMNMISEFVARNERRAVVHTSLGQVRYLSTIAQVDAVVGNSSSGLYEVPSFKKPTVNIGDRQKGRLQASSVINCEAQSASIESAIKRAFELDCSDTVNPYGDGHSAERIVAAIKAIKDPRDLVRKRFFDISHPQ